MNREFVIDYAREYYGSEPEYLWKNTPDACVFRHLENRKWYGLVMNISKEKLGISESGNIDILNVKCDTMMIGSMLLKKGYFPAYHMNKKHWLTIVLDGSVPEEEIRLFIDQSYELTNFIK